MAHIDLLPKGMDNKIVNSFTSYFQSKFADTALSYKTNYNAVGNITCTNLLNLASFAEVGVRPLPEAEIIFLYISRLCNYL